MDFYCESLNGKPVTIGFDTDPVIDFGSDPGFLKQENTPNSATRKLYLNRRHREMGVGVGCNIAASDPVCFVQVKFINVGDSDTATPSGLLVYIPDLGTWLSCRKSTIGQVTAKMNGQDAEMVICPRASEKPEVTSVTLKLKTPLIPSDPESNALCDAFPNLCN